MNNQDLKRPPEFGEGFVIKRPRVETLEKEKGGEDGKEIEKMKEKEKRGFSAAVGKKKEPFGDLFSGSDFNTGSSSSSSLKPKKGSRKDGGGDGGRTTGPDVYKIFGPDAHKNSVGPAAGVSRRIAVPALNKNSSGPGTSLRSPRTLNSLKGTSETSSNERKELVPLRSHAILRTGNLNAESSKSTTTTPVRTKMQSLFKSPIRKESSPEVFPVQQLKTPSLNLGTTTKSKLKPMPSPKFNFANVNLMHKSSSNLVSVTSLELPKLDLAEEDDEEETREKMELKRGLVVSPQKANGRIQKFVRGGLAERAQQQINRANTSLVLWRKEFEGLASRSTRPRPDLRLRVINVISISRDSSSRSNKAAPSHSILTLCQIVGEENEENRSLKVSFFSAGIQQQHLRTTTHPESNLIKGTEVSVWKPWTECGSGTERVLFCSRFIIMT